MSDSGVAQIDARVDDSEIEAAIAKLDEALDKKQQLLSDVGGSSESLDSGLQKQLAIFDKEVVNVSAKATQLIDDEGPQIKGIEAAGHRIIRMIPGLREADRLQKSVGQLGAGNVMGALSLALLAYSIIQQVQRMYVEQKRKQEEFEREVMKNRGYETREEFQQWQMEQKTGLNASRNRPVMY